jgi:Na+-transporting NADH:ubiquinone oxidoreductase subunit NqrE
MTITSICSASTVSGVTLCNFFTATCACLCMCMAMCMCMRVRVRVCTCVCMCVCVCVCMSVYVCVHAHVHVHVQRCRVYLGAPQLSFVDQTEAAGAHYTLL